MTALHIDGGHSGTIRRKAKNSCCVSCPTNVSCGLRKIWRAVAPVQEAHMRRAINIALVLGSIFVNVTASPNKTVAKTEAGMMQFHNVIWVSGLHIVLPEDMKSFPVELVPLP